MLTKALSFSLSLLFHQDLRMTASGTQTTTFVSCMEICSKTWARRPTKPAVLVAAAKLAQIPRKVGMMPMVPRTIANGMRKVIAVKFTGMIMLATAIQRTRLAVRVVEVM